MSLTPARALSIEVARLVPLILQGVHLEFLSGQSITYTQFLVLVAIHSYGRCTMKDLARSMHIRMPTATGIAERLVRAGYVRRLKEPADRRQVLIGLSAKGEAFMEKFRQVTSGRWEEVLRQLGPEDLKVFEKVLSRLEGVLLGARHGV